MRTLLRSMAVSVGATVIAAAATITQTTDPTALATALGGGGVLTINSASVVSGAPSQFGTYTGFTSPPVTIGNGVVLSTGQVVEVGPEFNNGLAGAETTPSTDTGAPGTAEFDAYAEGRIDNFEESNNVAALLVNFTLSAPSQIGFDFIFGSVEYPEYTSNYTDAFVAFLDGTAAGNQIVFDASNRPVQVGLSFANALTTADTNTAFANPHGLLRLQTFTAGQLSAGAHTLLFEIGDVNDSIVDSAVFISNLRAAQGQGGTAPPPAGVPEPGTLALFATGFLGVVLARRRKQTV